MSSQSHTSFSVSFASLVRPTITLLLVMTVITGMIYPALTTGIARAVFPSQARGSVITLNGRDMGSRLVGQSFTDSAHLHGRPSATSAHPYDARSSAGSNLGPSSAILDSLVRERVTTVRALEGLSATTPVPGDLVLASGSGLDPHISPAAAELQVARLARVRGISADSVRRIIARATSNRLAGMVGEPRVNVLFVNLMLDGASLQQLGAF
ncbi:MAG: potassium-transporting ATPase subunit KdpC [Gemmatimonadaceae bacterium]|nr:potassium-transporting ATPase subunit KdpC [Gemmatimonadaceae bacterium]